MVVKNHGSKLFSFCSWFIESAKVFSPLVFSKVVSCTFILSCITFQMDLVWFAFNKYSIASALFTLNFFLLLTATTRSRLQFVPAFHGGHIKRCNNLCLLLLWKDGHRKLQGHGYLLIWIELAVLAGGAAKILYYDDCRCADTTSISRISYFHFELGDSY